jgi:uncharacterized protein
MNSAELQQIESLCEFFVNGQAPADSAHGISHVRRVVANARQLCDLEGANVLVTQAAAWLHDCVPIAKNDARRAQGSKLAAAAAVEFLAGTTFPPDLLDEVHHAIEAHSFSAGIPARSLEAKVVQDADRLDSLGAIGIARCLAVGGKLDRLLFDPNDPFCERREPDDSRFTIDHFYQKLLTLPEKMQTAAGRFMADQRAQVMRDYLHTLRAELGM